MHRDTLEADYKASDPDEREIRCETCYGKGFCECDHGYDHDCEDCDGTGKTQADCYQDFAEDLYDTQHARDIRAVKEYEKCLSLF
jgi:RecJ-like exonuclease